MIQQRTEMRNRIVRGTWPFSVSLLLSGALLLLVLTGSGCQVMRQFRPTARDVLPAATVGPSATLDEILTSLNARTSKVRQVKTSVRVATAGLPGLRGDLLVERPNRLRLQAGLMGMTEAGFDIGSNDESFWIWQKVSTPGEPETFYHARHLDYQYSQLRQELQLQPAWLIDALGLVEFRASDRHEGPFPREDGRIEIRSLSSTPGATTVRRTVLDPRTLDIHQQSFYDGQGRLVAWLNSIRHEPYPDNGISLPRQIEIHVVPAGSQPLELTVNAGEYSINSIYGDPDRLWVMPQPAGVRQVDLSRGTMQEPEIQSTGRQSFRTDEPWQFR